MATKKDQQFQSDLQAVLDYLNTCNRPHSTQSLVDSMHGKIKKTQMQKCLDSLVVDQKIILKEWGKSKIYACRQDQFPKVAPEQMASIDETIKKVAEEASRIAKEVAVLKTEFQQLTAKPVLENLKSLMEDLRKELDTKTESLKDLRENATVISDEDQVNVKTKLKNNVAAWRKRKRTVNDMVGAISEASGKRPRELHEDIGIETDEEAKVDLKECDSLLKK
eukprot:TRINITY_DN37068_c0_g1_i1.p1 TRINITY_DN37068_c0_g1~~TRINITY_DN37068_c0_g1_i1.p1  ORF type:complete len:222 (+),score=61.52 TRINITY_DN37068_c0_g1_i1:46-711(+)